VDKYTKEVVNIAQIVPIGIDFCASAKSPDLFDPAIIPKHTQKTIDKQTFGSSPGRKIKRDWSHDGLYKLS
jgi:hypothetical protein